MCNSLHRKQTNIKLNQHQNTTPILHTHTHVSSSPVITNKSTKLSIIIPLIIFRIYQDKIHATRITPRKICNTPHTHTHTAMQKKINTNRNSHHHHYYSQKIPRIISKVLIILFVSLYTHKGTIIDIQTNTTHSHTHIHRRYIYTYIPYIIQNKHLNYKNTKIKRILFLCDM